MTRKICYISGTRADFGLMERVLHSIHTHPDLSLRLAITGMHLSDDYGRTEQDIIDGGFDIDCRIPVNIKATTGEVMACNIGTMLQGFTTYLARTRPDIVLVLGDRGEMLAGALAALHLNIAVAHVHGGERSGTVDEPIRHAISKLSHIHFVTTQEARQRLIHMGEREDAITVAGAPGVENIRELATLTRVQLCKYLDLDPAKPTALFVFHPVVQEADIAGRCAAQLLEHLLSRRMQVVALKPNSDAGGNAIAAELERRSDDPLLRVVTHFKRPVFVSWMAAADIMFGNTSAGIIEAASFGTPVINIGNRQNLRERNINTIDVDFDIGTIAGAIDKALDIRKFPDDNIYEQPHTCQVIADMLCRAEIDDVVLNKINCY